MAVKSIDTGMKQSWGFKVDYITHDGEVSSLESIFIATKMDTVLRYLERKFKRLAQKTESIDVWDNGLISTGKSLRLELMEHPDLSITASRANGEILMTEGVAPTLSAPRSVFTADKPSPMVVIASPALSTYKDAFDLVSFPAQLWDLNCNTSHFRAEFYNVFPREK